MSQPQPIPHTLQEAAQLPEEPPYGQPTTRGLPLAPLLSPLPRSSLFCVVTPIDDRSRLADRSPIRTVGWSPGQPVTISITCDHTVIVRRGGPESITGHGHLRLPSRVRHMCRLSAGDRLFVTVSTPPSLLVVYPMAALEAILFQHHASASVIGKRHE